VQATRPPAKKLVVVVRCQRCRYAACRQAKPLTVCECEAVSLLVATAVAHFTYCTDVTPVGDKCEVAFILIVVVGGLNRE